MDKNDRWVPSDEWEVIVDNMPIVSVDLIVKYEGGVLLGLRENEPAKGEWFVPGGTVLKNERLTEAVQRVAETELGCEVAIQEELGVFEHFYDTSEIDGVDSNHYVANAFVVEPVSGQQVSVSDDQHSQLRVFEPPFEDLHPYVHQYLEQIA
ncbi:GDP-mannose mannosyl hydrolase [Natrarchaeobius chitinivorans]|uniref:NUDIX domain-containing protein n=1 Tax=Natrarchaeobius chitinivorans TaxID=1679083 RepID=A0A3N6LYV9_NATCH|nr:NUDIX domain-containing protein [Natrarchaeobius chitinivorans]RQG96038.1 NUDIX domain-containing protein [Natrarchaeobius chitinivorans]